MAGHPLMFQEKNMRPPGAVVHHVLLSIGYLAEPKWRCAPFTEIDPVYIRWVRTQTAKVRHHEKPCIFSEIFVFQIETPKYYTENWKLVTHGKTNGKKPT